MCHAVITIQNNTIPAKGNVCPVSRVLRLPNPPTSQCQRTKRPRVNGQWAVQVTAYLRDVERESRLYYPSLSNTLVEMLRSSVPLESMRSFRQHSGRDSNSRLSPESCFWLIRFADPGYAGTEYRLGIIYGRRPSLNNFSMSFNQHHCFAGQDQYGSPFETGGQWRQVSGLRDHRAIQTSI